ncbi:hypothetical protein MCERE19_00692 [Spirosomataceae bacterium]
MNNNIIIWSSGEGDFSYENESYLLFELCVQLSPRLQRIFEIADIEDYKNVEFAFYDFVNISDENILQAREARRLEGFNMIENLVWEQFKIILPHRAGLNMLEWAEWSYNDENSDYEKINWAKLQKKQKQKVELNNCPDAVELQNRFDVTREEW